MKKLLLLMLYLTLFPIFLVAQEEDKTEEETSQDYYVVVEEEALDSTSNQTATKVPVPIQKTPASVGVVESSLFKAQAATYLGDALKNISGINVQNGFGTFDLFYIRGLESLSNGLILTDGAAEPEVTFYNLYNVDRVEVLKGPGAFLYGGNPLSGTVHLIRKQPLFTNLLEVENSYGSFQSYQGTVDWNYAAPEKDIAFRLNGTWLNSEGFRDDKESRAVAINPTFSWRIDSNSFLKANFEYVDNEYEPDAGLPLVNNEIPDVPLTRSYQSPFDTSQQQISRLRLDYERRISNALILRNKFYYTDLDWKSDGTLFIGAFPNGFGGTAILRTQTLLDDRQKLTGNQFEIGYSFQTGSVKHELLSGIELSRLNDEFTLDVALLPAIDLVNPVETATSDPFIIPGLSQVGDAASVVFAPYFVDQISFNEKFQIFAGGRFDVLDYDDPATSTERNEEQFSPLFGAVFSPRQDLSFYANAGKAFAPPSTLVAGERQPEESTQFEAGVKKQLIEGRLNTTFAFYHLDKENIAIPDDNGITQQAGDLKSTGFEFELTGRPAEKWQTFFSYSFNDAELTRFAELVQVAPGSFLVIDRSGNTPAFAPRHILNLWVMHDWNDRITVGGGPRYVSSQFIAEDNRFQIDDYLTLDAYVAYSIENWRFSLNFKNLTDHEFQTRGFGSTSVIPADPFAVYASIDFRL